MSTQRGWIAATALALCALASEASAATRSVAAGGDLQAALDAAQPGDVIELQAGATFIGNFVLPVKSGSSYITIRSSAPDASLPPANTRITPSYAAALPKIQSPNNVPAIATAPGAHHFALVCLELRANDQGIGDILVLGDGDRFTQTTLSSVPHDLIVDRVYVHGDPTYGQKRGIGLNSASTTIVNSYISEIKADGQDSQAIAGWNGPGPYTIVNNYLEAASENLLIGGADPGIPNLVPSDITIRQNYFTKPLAWRSQPQWNVKNLLELKNAQHVVIDGNVLEYSWEAAQSGYAVMLTPRNQDGTAPWSVVQNVLFTNNVVRHAASGIAILGTDNEKPSEMTNNIVVRNNLFEDISSHYGGAGRFLLMNGGANVTIDHNTVMQDGWTSLYADEHTVQSFVFTNNVIPDYQWAVMGGNTAPGNNTIATYFPNGQFFDNVFIGSSPSTYPIGNYYPATMSAVGFVSLTGGDYHLDAASPYRAGATDGGAIGCNVDALAIDAAISGNATGAPPPSPPSPPSPPPSSPAPAAPAPDPAPTAQPSSSGDSGDSGTTIVSTDPMYEMPAPPGAYGFSDHGYYRPEGGWQETRMIAPGGTAVVRAPSSTFTTTTTTTTTTTAPTYEIPPPPGAYGFSDHGYYRPQGGWQETRMIAPGRTIQTTISAPAATAASIPRYTTPPPPGAYGFTDHGYYRPDGGWQSASMLAVSTTSSRAVASASSTAVPTTSQSSIAAPSAPGSSVAAPNAPVSGGSDPSAAAAASVGTADAASRALVADAVFAPRTSAATSSSAAPSAVVVPTVTTVQPRATANDQTRTVRSEGATAKSSVESTPAAPAAIPDAPRVMWSVAPQPGVSYQWWVFTNGGWTLAQDWTASATFSMPLDPAAGIPVVGVVMR